MKKIYTKLSRPQWRVTVPTINTSLFGRTFSSPEEKTCSVEEKCENFRNSGSYDLVAEAEKMEEEKEILKVEVKEETDESDHDSRYEDARDKSLEIEADEQNIYADVENVRPISGEASSETSSSYEYDVPRISFHFFEEGLREFAEEHKLVMSSPQKRKSEIRITLAQPPVIEEEDEIEDDSLKTNESQSDVSILATRCEIGEPKLVEMSLSLDNLSVGRLSRCYSDCSLELRLKDSDPSKDDSEEEGFYKIPRNLKRLSQSLDNIQTISKLDQPPEIPELPELPDLPRNNIVIEHDIVLKKHKSDETQSSLEYCDARSKLPLKFRRTTLLRRPHVRSKAADTWLSLRSKVTNIISTHSAAQRVGANSGEKLVNLEELYKNSRTKCKKIVQNTSKIFNKKRGQENVDPNCSDTSSQIVKNDAFFAKVNENGASEVDCGEVGSDRFGGSKLFDEESKGMSEFDFSTLKSAFRRSRIIGEVLLLLLF